MDGGGGDDGGGEGGGGDGASKASVTGSVSNAVTARPSEKPRSVVVMDPSVPSTAPAEEPSGAMIVASMTASPDVSLRRELVVWMTAWMSEAVMTRSTGELTTTASDSRYASMSKLARSTPLTVSDIMIAGLKAPPGLRGGGGLGGKPGGGSDGGGPAGGDDGGGTAGGGTEGGYM